MRVPQPDQTPGFSQEGRFMLVRQHYLEDFDSRLALQMNMLSKIDISETSLSYKADEAIVTKLLSHTVSHTRTSSYKRRVKLSKEPRQNESK